MVRTYGPASDATLVEKMVLLDGPVSVALIGLVELRRLSNSIVSPAEALNVRLVEAPAASVPLSTVSKPLGMTDGRHRRPDLELGLMLEADVSLPPEYKPVRAVQGQGSPMEKGRCRKLDPPDVSGCWGRTRYQLPEVDANVVAVRSICSPAVPAIR